MPKIKWVKPGSEVSSEGEDISFCFSNEIASAVPYQVEVGVRYKGDTAANGKDYYTTKRQSECVHENCTCYCSYTLHIYMQRRIVNLLLIIDADYIISSPVNFTVSAHTAEETFCVNISIVDDSILEATEQFELYFENLPSALAISGTPDTINIDILDNDGKLNPESLIAICTDLLIYNNNIIHLAMYNYVLNATSHRCFYWLSTSKIHCE